MSNEQPMLEPELTEFFGEFVTAFSTFDGDVIARRYAVPYLAIAADGSARVYADRSAVASYFQEVVDQYRTRGVRSCRFRDLQFMPIGARFVLAAVTWDLVLQDGTVQSTWRESYNIHRAPSGLMIQASTDHDE
jgi:hypothetical protein